MVVQIPILEYHDLGRILEKKRSFHTPYVLESHKFYDQLHWLNDNDFETISIDDLFNGRITDKSVIITFDDGHISNYEEAFFLLQEFDFQATFFLVAQLVGRENYLTVEYIQEMQDAGMHFESHSLTHPYLLSLDRYVMAIEIRESKRVIEEMVSKKVNHFCIPYGFYNRELIQCVINAGYKSAVTERIGYFSKDELPFKVLPRFTIKAQMTQNDFIHIMRRQRTRMASQYFQGSILHWAKKILGFKGYMRLKSLLVPSDN